MCCQEIVLPVMNMIRKMFRISLRKCTNKYFATCIYEHVLLYAYVCIYSVLSSFGNIHFLRYDFDIIASRDASSDNPAVFSRVHVAYLTL